MSPDRLFGLYYVATLFHSGGGSRGYRLICKINVRWGSDDAARLLPRDEWAEARTWAAHYMRIARRDKNAF